MISFLAFARNLGTQAVLSNMTGLLGGGVVRSSDEASESLWSKGATLVGESHESTRDGGNS